jgi:hypothetical protein
MKFKTSVITFLALVLVCATPLFAAAKNTTNITIDQSVKVAATVLRPGDYKVEWQGAGPQVEARFLQNGKVVVTAPATLQANDGPYQEGVEFATASGDTNAKLLQKVYAKHQQLTFQPGSSPAGE